MCTLNTCAATKQDSKMLDKPHTQFSRFAGGLVALDCSVRARAQAFFYSNLGQYRPRTLIADLRSLSSKYSS